MPAPRTLSRLALALAAVLMIVTAACDRRTDQRDTTTTAAIPSKRSGPPEQAIRLPGDALLTMVRIPAGSFLMGRAPDETDGDAREDPRHRVTVAAFWIGRYEITKRQWRAVMGTAPWTGQQNVSDDPDSPAVCVSWYDAKAFCDALTSHAAETDQAATPFRLPSEAEWEYACRAGTTAPFYWGADPDCALIDDYAWQRRVTHRVGYDRAHPVGRKLPNGFGLFDMIGNAAEWCEDDWHDDYAGAPADGSAWVDAPRGSFRVQRGGCWFSDCRDCRSASRARGIPTGAPDNRALGFRIVRSVAVSAAGS